MIRRLPSEQFMTVLDRQILEIRSLVRCVSPSGRRPCADAKCHSVSSLHIRIWGVENMGPLLCLLLPFYHKKRQAGPQSPALQAPQRYLMRRIPVSAIQLIMDCRGRFRGNEEYDELHRSVY
jgi:hypothetical protein